VAEAKSGAHTANPRYLEMEEIQAAAPSTTTPQPPPQPRQAVPVIGMAPVAVPVLVLTGVREQIFLALAESAVPVVRECRRR
jgi:hypothetical protein